VAGAFALAVQRLGRRPGPPKAPAGQGLAASGNIATDSSNMAAPPGAGKTS